MKKFTMPAIGAIYPAAPNKDVPNPGASHEQLPLIRWRLAQAQDKASEQNDVRKKQFLERQFPDWLANYTSGRLLGPSGIPGDPAAVPPVAPIQFAVLVVPNGPVVDFQVEDGAECLRLVDEMIKQGVIDRAPAKYNPVPVCAVPAYQKLLKPVNMPDPKPPAD